MAEQLKSVLELAGHQLAISDAHEGIGFGGFSQGKLAKKQEGFEFHPVRSAHHPDLEQAPARVAVVARAIWFILIPLIDVAPPVRRYSLGVVTLGTGIDILPYLL